MYRRALLVVSFSMWSAVANAQPADIRHGLIAYWPLETTDGLTTPDATALGNHLNLVAMNASNFVPGRHGNAATFNGTSQILSRIYAGGADGNLPIYNARRFTIAMWVKGIGATQGDRRVFSEGSTNSTNPLFNIGTDSAAAASRTNVLDMFIRNDANTAIVSHRKSTSMVFDGNWHHIAWVEGDGNAQLYVDGVLDATVFNYTRTGTFTAYAVSLGGIQRATAGSFFNGMIDDAALWERPLSQSEVQDVMNNSMVAPVPEFPPYIDIAPVGGTYNLGDRITFRVRAVGARPLSYQWLRNGFEIPDATSATLTLSNLTVADSDTYSVRVTNPLGSVTSDAVLTVIDDPAPDVRAGLVSHWPMDDFIFDEFATYMPDSYSRNDFLMKTDSFFDLTTGVYGNAVLFNGVDQHGVRQGGFPTYKNSGYTIAMWVNANGIGQSDRRFFAEGSTNNNTPLFALGTHTTGADGTLRVFIRNDANTTMVSGSSRRTVLDGTWHHVVWTDTNGRARLYIDGVLDETEFNYTPGTLTLDQTAVGAIVRAAVAGFFTGALDDVAVWNRVLSLSEVQEIRTAGIPPPLGAIPPQIVEDPVSQSVLTRTRVTLSFVASGTSPLSIQWRRSGTNMPGETNLRLVFPSITLEDAGEYSVAVANSAGRATSAVATLTVALRPEPPNDLRVDINNRGNETAVETEPGFLSFATPAEGIGPFTRTFGGADVTITGVGVNMDTRFRVAPTNNGAFTQERLLRDFIFARDTVVGQGMDINVEFLEPNAPYNVTLWSFDSESATARISDWYANGALIAEGYIMDRTILPTSNEQYQIRFTTTSDASGRILIEGRRNASATATINVFLNALQVTRRELRIQKVEVRTFDLALTFQTEAPGGTYQIVEKSSLSDATWTEVQGVTFSDLGSAMEATLPIPEGTRFYRVLQPTAP